MAESRDFDCPASEDEENKVIQQMDLHFECIERYIQKCRKLLENKRKAKLYPTNSETLSTIASFENLVQCNKEIADDMKLLPELLSFAKSRNWKQVMMSVLSVCMEIDIAECKYLQREGIVSKLNKPNSVELANFDVWKKCAMLREGNENHTAEEFDSPSEECFVDTLPTQIAKEFCKIYDTYWSEAFNQIKTCFGDEKEEEDMIKDIANITKLIFDYTKEKVSMHVVTMASAMTKLVMEPLKQKAQRDFASNQLPRKYKSYLTLDKVMNLVNKCAKLSWHMNLMDPPMVLLWPTGTTKEKLFNYFRYFTKFGSDLDFSVWPALLLYADGPIMVRGTAQLK